MFLCYQFPNHISFKSMTIQTLVPFRRLVCKGIFGHFSFYAKYTARYTAYDSNAGCLSGIPQKGIILHLPTSKWYSSKNLLLTSLRSFAQSRRKTEAGMGTMDIWTFSMCNLLVIQVLLDPFPIYHFSLVIEY